MKKTKVIATIGPSSYSKEILKDMIKNGMDIARINLTHADHDFCKKVIKTIRDLNKELKRNMPKKILHNKHFDIHPYRDCKRPETIMLRQKKLLKSKSLIPFALTYPY